MAMRPSSRVLRNCLKPSPSLPSRWSAGTRQSLEGQAVGVGGVPAELVVGRLDGEARCAGRDHDRAEICGEPSSLVPVRAVTVTTEVMSVPELVMNALAPLTTHSSPSRTRLGAGGTGVGAGVGLGQAERRERAPGDEVGQPALLLLLGAVGEDRVDAQADAGRQRDADRLVDPAELLDGDAQRR